MSTAADYPIRFLWRRHSFGPTGEVGDPTDVYTAPAPLWGGYRTDRAGSIVTVLDAETQETRATVRVRNYPDVKPLDTITDQVSGEVWRVDTVIRGRNELVLDLVRSSE